MLSRANERDVNCRVFRTGRSQAKKNESRYGTPRWRKATTRSASGRYNYSVPLTPVLRSVLEHTVKYFLVLTYLCRLL